MTAEEQLNQILFKKNNKNLTQKVNSYIHKFHIRMKALDDLDKQEHVYFMQLLFKTTIEEVRINFDGPIRNFLRNVIAGKFRNKIKIINEKKK